MEMTRNFGCTKEGNQASLYVIRNENGMEAAVTDLGATLVSLKVKNKEGSMADVVLGYENAAGYEAGTCFFGTIVGRNANRIGGAQFELNGKTYHLTGNDNGNNLHSGMDFYNIRIWETEEVTETSVRFKLHSPDGDQGYPGTADIYVTYSLDKDDKLDIFYEALSDKDTILNMTNHSYFNLSGSSDNTIYKDILKIDSDYLIGIDKNSIPCETINLDNNIFNFKEAKKLEEFFKANDKQKTIANNGIDHPYIFNEKIGKLEIKNIKSGIKMSVETNNPAVVIYTANYLQDIGFKKHSAICFETQEVPNLYRDKNINVYPTFIDENTHYEKYTKFIFEDIN